MKFIFQPLRPVAVALVLAAGGTNAVAQSSDDPPPAIDPMAVEIAERAVEHLSLQPDMVVGWFVSYDVVIDGREKVTHTRSGENRLARGTGFSSYAENGDRLREYFFDGGTFWIHNIEDNAYAELPFAGGFDELVERIRVEYDIALPIWELMSRDGAGRILEGLEAAAYLGETRLAGRPAHHLAFATYDQDWQVWISTDETNPVIYSLVGTNPYAQGWPQYRAYFHDWNFAPDFEDGAFSFSPPDDAIRMALPKVQSAAASELDEILNQGSSARTSGGQNADQN